MRTGLTISVAGHAGALLLAAYGGIVATPTQEPVFEIADVQIISEQEFVAATTPAPTVPSAPVAPADPKAETIETIVPALASTELPALVVLDLEKMSAPRLEAAEAVPEPAVEAQSDSALLVPAALQILESLVPTIPEFHEPELALNEIDTSMTLDDLPTLQAAPRIADRPAPEPEPDAVEADEVRLASTPDPTAEAEAGELVEQTTAPAHTSDRIVTEAEERDGPLAVQRPRQRPTLLGSASQPDPEPETADSDKNVIAMIQQDQQDQQDHQVNEIAASVIAATKTPRDLPEIPGTLTPSEGQRLVAKIRGCWNLGATSTEALRTTVKIRFSMTDEGKPVQNSVKLVSSNSESALAVRRAFEVGRTAILKCLENGHDLPVEKYEQWRHVEITFDPREMMRK